jgi:hypothetical protein
MVKRTLVYSNLTVPLRRTAWAICLALLVLTQTSAINERQPAGKIKFSITFPAARSTAPLDGRVLLLLSTNNEKEPREQISDALDTQQLFGIDVENWQPGAKALIDSTVLGYPVKSLAQVPAGTYWVQAVLHKYETFKRSDGHTIKLPMDRGEGQHWNLAPGNLISKPKQITLDPNRAATFDILLDQEIPPIAPAKDTKYIKHVKIQSERLTKFWGRPMFLGAAVLIPHGFAEHPEARYPLIVNHGHYPHTFEGFRETPPDPNLKPDYSARFRLSGYNKIQQEYAHKLYLDWISKEFPRFVIIEIQHANPFYDDSYAVNSANLGPYGDAINYELIPFIEKQFRCIGQGWARFTYGGSTGGWEALATQMFYPDMYNGCFAACPDPIDFRAYTVVNIYEDKNAYYAGAPWKQVPRPGQRNYLGHVNATLEQMNHKELVLGTKSRSGDQWDIWQAVFSPVGADGYPKPIWNKFTGALDPAVAAYWRKHYDLGYILKRDWAKLGPKLEGKIHLYCGDMDNYYLNNAVYLVEEFLKTTTNPFYAGEVAYGDRAEHCWNGDPTLPNAISRLRYHQMYVPKILNRIKQAAPAGADVTSWRY